MIRGRMIAVIVFDDHDDSISASELASVLGWADWVADAGMLTPDTAAKVREAVLDDFTTSSCGAE